MNEVKIELINGKWFINGKHNSLTSKERELLSDFFKYYKLKTEED